MIWNVEHTKVPHADAQWWGGFHPGTLGKGMRAAITAVRAGYKEMIDAWRAT
jgi:hypothetical protein